jgi:hypothetical protein
MQKIRCRSNEEKLKVLIFIPDKALAIPTLVIGGPNVRHVSTFKYLGSCSQRGATGTHTKYVLQQMNGACGVWYPMFACNKLPVLVRLLMVRTVFTPLQLLFMERTCTRP